LVSDYIGTFFSISTTESAFYSTLQLALLFEDSTAIGTNNAHFTQTTDTCASEFLLTSSYTEPADKQQKVILKINFEVVGNPLLIVTDPITVITTSTNQAIFQFSTDGSPCDDAHMITTLSDCQAASDLYAHSTTSNVADVNATDKMAGCQINLDDDEVSFNSNFDGEDTDDPAVFAGLCRTDGTINGCMDEFDCADVTQYCSSGLCAAKSCSDNDECWKTGFCDSD
jgi:hypothetical protein